MSSFDLTNASLSLSLDEFEKRYVEPWLKTQSMEVARTVDQWILDQYRIAEGYEKPYVRIEGKAKITKIGMIRCYQTVKVDRQQNPIPGTGRTVYISGEGWEFLHDDMPPGVPLLPMGGYTGEELALIAKQWGDKSSGI